MSIFYLSLVQLVFIFDKYFKMKENRAINSKSKKMMLWAGMISMTMTFGSLTSAYIVSSQRPDWTLNSISLHYFIGTLVIIKSSITFWISKKMIRKGEIKNANLMLFSTLILAVIFIFLQFNGFKQIINQGYYFTGPESSISTSFIYVLVMLHLVHLLSGMIVLIVVLINSLNQKYTDKKLSDLILLKCLAFSRIFMVIFVLFFNI